MVMIYIFLVVFGTATGIGLAMWILASKLEKRNSYGDNHGDATLYSTSLTITDRSERMAPKNDLMVNYINLHTPQKPQYPTVPRGGAPVEKVRK